MLSFVSVLRFREPVYRLVGDFHEHQHHRHFDQHSDDRGQRHAGIEREQCNRHGDRQFEEVAGADHAGGSRHVMRQFHPLRTQISKEEDEERLKNQGNADQNDVKKIVDDQIALQREDQYQCKQQPGDRQFAELGNERFVVVLQSLALDHVVPRQGRGEKRNHDEEHDRQEQRAPRYDDIADAEQQTDNRNKQNENDQIVGRHLHKRIRRVAAGETAPDEHHRRARRGAEDDCASEVVAGQVIRNPRLEDHQEEQTGNQKHRKRFDQPVDDPSQKQTAWSFADVDDRREVDLEHHRVNHHPDQNTDWDVDVVHFKLIEKLRNDADVASNQNTKRHASKHEYGQIGFKETDLP